MSDGPIMSYLTHPVEQKGFPSGLPFIVGNEAAERFSFYGMRTILVVFMTQYMMSSSGQPDVMSDADAKGWYHLFVSAVFFTPVIGALMADVWLGKYRTIILLSMVYCAGHLTLALDDTRFGLALGLGLIALGAVASNPVFRHTWAISSATPTRVLSAMLLAGFTCLSILVRSSQLC
jgi:POT family proton-dependent oligopeptide transporter